MHNILVVDDEIVSLKKAELILSQYGKCMSVRNGAGALAEFRLAHLRDEPFDLITIDIRMEDMDGIELLKKIREWEKKHNVLLGHGLKVLMITAQSAPDVIFKSFRAGCEAYVTKPFSPDDIDIALSKLNITKPS